jgi:hypothetical protein
MPDRLGRLLVTGSRSWISAAPVYNAILQNAQRGDTLVVGDASGADFIARAFWMNTYGPVERHAISNAEWREHGKRAGILRNERMVASGADLCLAFIELCRDPACHGRTPHGTHGATHCARAARKAGIPVLTWGEGGALL